MQHKPQVILTWVSWSGKSSLMDSLLKLYPRLFSKPIQYTTRQPRSDDELDSYVFLTKQQFISKLENWDFIEYTIYNWNYYAISVFNNYSTSNIFIVEPVWRAALKKYFHQNWIPYRWFYLELDEQSARQRMINRWDSKKSIDERLKDFLYFHPEVDDKILDADVRLEKNVSLVVSLLWASQAT